MSYDNPQTQLETFATMDFGAATGSPTVYKIFGPAGKKGKLRDIGVYLSEATVWTTTLGLVQVGTLTDPDAYGQLNITTGQAINTIFNSVDDTDAVIAADLPADTVILVTLTEGTGGSITGQGITMVTIDWF